MVALASSGVEKAVALGAEDNELAIENCDQFPISNLKSRHIIFLHCKVVNLLLHQIICSAENCALHSDLIRLTYKLTSESLYLWSSSMLCKLTGS